MREMGVTFQEIAKQSHRTHGTVIVGVKRFKGYLSMNDEKRYKCTKTFTKDSEWKRIGKG